MNNNKKTEEKTGLEKARETAAKLKGVVTEKEVKPEPAQEKAVSVKTETVLPAEMKNGQLILTEKHKQLIKEQIAPTATKEELELFLMMAYRTRLDPLLKQLYFIKYGTKVSYVTSIDGYRIIAHRTGEFDGVDEPEYKYVNNMLYSCTIRVYRKGSSHAFAATVKFKEYTTSRNNWVSMPETMIAKVAEAHALRKAFPQDLSGIYTTDEMEQAGNGEQKPEAPRIPMMTKDQMDTLKLFMEGKSISIDKLKTMVLTVFKKDSLSKLTRVEADKLLKVMDGLPTPEVEEVKGEVVEDTTSPDYVDPDEADKAIEEAKKNKCEICGSEDVHKKGCPNGNQKKAEV